MKTRFLTVISFLFATLPLFVRGQYYDIGQAPASTRWMKIDTGNFRFIFPDYLTEQARETAIYFTSRADEVTSGLKVKPRKTPVILHPRSAISNAYAIWAPRRIEVFTTPPQDIYAQPWLHQLALHEYRHIAQISKTDQGITHALGYLFGQQINAAFTGLFVPSWFLEGDAVVAETALSQAGRGRAPAFNAPLRAIMAEKGIYSYPKASLGSYRDFVPDIYAVGYHIIAASRMSYGKEPWNSAMNFVARKPMVITPFNCGLKKVTGLNKRKTYYQSMNYLNNLWEGRQSGDGAARINPERAVSYTSYHYPQQTGDSSFIALKTSLHAIPRIVRIETSGKETLLHTPGYVFDNHISYGNGIVVWSEYRPHVRWETVSHTDLVYLDTQTGKIIRRKFADRLFAPSISRDGSKTVAIGNDDAGRQYLAVIQNGSMTKYPLAGSISGSYPRWSDDMTAIAFIATAEAGKALMLFKPENGEFSEVLPFSYSEISEPVFSGRDLLFTASVGGKSQICRVNPETGEAVVLTAAAYGAFSPSANGNTLAYLEYTADGSRIACRGTGNLTGPVYQPDTDASWPLAAALSGQEGYKGERFQATSGGLKPEKYQKAAHLFNIHSWAPSFINTDSETAQPGFSVMSQNLLSTMFVTAGYDYNIHERAGIVRTDVVWKGWYPELSAGISHGIRAATMSDENGKHVRYTWNETSLKLSVAQALNFSRGRYTKGLYAQISDHLIKTGNFTTEHSQKAEGLFSALSYRLFNYAYMRQAYRDFAPRLGYNIDMRYRHTPFGDIASGHLFALQSQVFLPGFGANNSLSVYSGFQEVSHEKYRFIDVIGFSRGYAELPASEKAYSLKITYRLPLRYPDTHLGGLLYVKRIRWGMFYDTSRLITENITGYYNSAGADLTFDYHLFGLSTPVSTTFRTSYLMKHNEAAFNILFSINFYEY